MIFFFNIMFVLTKKRSAYNVSVNIDISIFVISMHVLGVFDIIQLL